MRSTSRRAVQRSAAVRMSAWSAKCHVVEECADVKLKSKPTGAKRFRSEAASTDYTFKRKLTVPGRCRIVCTLHDDMTMKIRARR
jgi:plastocyanin